MLLCSVVDRDGGVPGGGAGVRLLVAGVTDQHPAVDADLATIDHWRVRVRRADSVQPAIAAVDDGLRRVLVVLARILTRIATDAADPQKGNRHGKGRCLHAISHCPIPTYE